ncbi:hypothetical protein E6W39_15440 [Kitasatospora acidiphila]|uniref:Uncharacterized protein n=1 Tax=Kitasatospora acidiphila TaxID=2567942 RepID=A0A540W2X6_9ACTN|nr:hypothetical protein [Kitasatospora acidiphila]TQF03368.1 hypothetical protein E6W39_15440 [Kitasatospora acidiphila]
MSATVSAEGEADGAPGAGSQEVGPPDSPSPGTALPAEGTLGEQTSSPLPVPRGELLDCEAAERVLLSLRKVDARLVLGSAEAARLAPLAAQWLARGVSAAGLRYALAAGLPPHVKCPAALVRHRLREKMPEDEADRVPLKLAMCTGCERGFRVIADEERCGECRAASPVQPPEPAPARPGWRERMRLVGGGSPVLDH